MVLTLFYIELSSDNYDGNSKRIKAIQFSKFSKYSKSNNLRYELGSSKNSRQATVYATQNFMKILRRELKTSSVYTNERLVLTVS
jgi:hypothetical protein